MKVLQVHNFYRTRGGEGEVFDTTIRVLREKGVSVSVATRHSRDVAGSRLSLVRAFGSGIYSLSAARDIREILQVEKPDVVHSHNLLPLFSPSVLVACRKAGVPTVMTCQNFRLVCPTGLYTRKGRICELCSGGREYWCALTNCRDNVFESLAYATRNTIHRKSRLFAKNVSLFLAISQTVRSRLSEYGLASHKVIVVPNPVPMPARKANCTHGRYVAFIGRFTQYKGIDTLLDAAQRTQLPVHLAGDFSKASDFEERSSDNVVFRGLLGGAEKQAFFEKAVCLVVPSKHIEPFGLAAVEGMSYGLPVIASNTGGLKEIVDDGVTGFLVEPGRPDSLASKMELLWDDRELCERLGSQGRLKAANEYGEDIYYDRLMGAYEAAIKACHGVTKREFTL